MDQSISVAVSVFHINVPLQISTGHETSEGSFSLKWTTLHLRDPQMLQNGYDLPRSIISVLLYFTECSAVKNNSVSEQEYLPFSKR